MPTSGLERADRSPVVRCLGCGKIVFAAHEKCLACGSEYTAPLVSFDAKEFYIMDERGIDPEFLQLFEPAGRDNELFVRSRKNGKEDRHKEKGNYGAAEMA